MSPKPPFALISPRASRPEPGIHSERRSQLAAGATSATLTVHKVLGAYGVFIFGVSVVYYVENQYTAAAVCDGLAVLVMLCAILANVGDGAPPKKGEDGFTKWMVGVHLGMLLPPAIALGTMTLGAMHQLELINTRRTAACVMLVLASALATFYIVVLRPKKAEQKSSAPLV